MAKTVSSLSEIPAVNEYLSRIGAEPRSLLVAVVKEKQGAYWQDVAVVKFERDGKVSAPDAFLPTESEIAKLTAAFSEFEFPKVQKVKSLSGDKIPESLKNAEEKDIFEFRDMDGSILMVQLRREGEDGEKNYVPYTYWSDGKWRVAEPEGLLPVWGLDQLKNFTTVFIHEGAKAAKYARWLAEAKTPQAKKALAEHPWGEELVGAAHVGWIGGALSPARTDWSVLKYNGMKRAYIVSDNDSAGRQAIPAISMRIRVPTFHLQFTNEWPASFDLADAFPSKMFKEIEGTRHYIGPSFRSCLHPATWATDLIPNERGKPSVVLRQHFKDMWAYIEEADLWVCTEMPEIVRTEKIVNNMLAGFSHASETTKILLRKYQGRNTKICYRPDHNGRLVTDRGSSAINLHIPSAIKPVAGDPKPWLDFLNYMFPNEVEREKVEKWCATLIARPDIKMGYGLLLVSEAQGIGKTTLGAEILGKLVGDGNVGFPSEKTITDATFTDWIAQKRLIMCNEIYSGHSWKAYNTLKTYITDKDITINAKYQRPYRIDNWAHMIACSNSLRALRMEEDDRRWFYPEVSEIRWPPEKFKELYNWLQSGGLSIIAHWAEHYGKYVRPQDIAPMTDSKREMIAGSRSEAQTEVAVLAEICAKRSEPIALAMKAVVNWVRSNVQGRVFDSDYELRKSMKDVGMYPSKGRVFIDGRLQTAILNEEAFKTVQGKTAKEAGVLIRQYNKKPEDIFEGDM